MFARPPVLRAFSTDVGARNGKDDDVEGVAECSSPEGIQSLLRETRKPGQGGNRAHTRGVGQTE